MREAHSFLSLKKQKSDTRRPGALFILENNINFHYKPMQ